MAQYNDENVSRKRKNRGRTWILASHCGNNTHHHLPSQPVLQNGREKIRTVEREYIQKVCPQQIGIYLPRSSRRAWQVVVNCCSQTVLVVRWALPDAEVAPSLPLPLPLSMPLEVARLAACACVSMPPECEETRLTLAGPQTMRWRPRVESAAGWQLAHGELLPARWCCHCLRRWCTLRGSALPRQAKERPRRRL